MTAVEKIIQTAKAEVGYLEKASNAQLDSKTANAGDKNYTKYARDLDALKVYNSKKQGCPWCDLFVDWCFIQSFGLETGMAMTFQPMGGLGAGCNGSASYYKAKGRFYSSGPKAGDQIFFKSSKDNTLSHTGLVVKVDGDKVYTVEGNTSSAAGVEANGGCVWGKSYALSYARIGGYGRPDYSLAEVKTTKKEDDDMDEAKFKEMWSAMRKDLQDNDCGVWSAEDREWAVSNGIVQGSGTTASGEPNYCWQDFLTREQMVAVLHRFAKLMGTE